MPDPSSISDPLERDSLAKALRYMDLPPGKPLLGHPVNVVFIGSCTNSRISDLRAAAAILEGPQGQPERARDGGARIAADQSSRRRPKVWTAIFKEAGAEWREAGCSMCIAMNGDQLQPGEYSVSTSNRNFEGRQGKGRPNVPRQSADRRSQRHHRRGDRRADLSKEHLTWKNSRRSRAASLPLPIDNIDTDQIIPGALSEDHFERRAWRSAFLRLALRCRRQAKARFHPEPARRQSARTSCWRAITSAAAARANMRPGRLTQYGFRAVISTSFADIFKGNSLKNSLLPIVVPAMRMASFSKPSTRIPRQR